MIELHRLSAESVLVVSEMVGELLKEIVNKTGLQMFDFELESTTRCLSGFFAEGLYDGFIARDGNTEVGVATISQSHALYADGAFGTIQEFYVRPQYRSRGVGSRLLGKIFEACLEKGWNRLEVATPQLPHFERTISFYEQAGFAVTGGRKLWIKLNAKEE